MSEKQKNHVVYVDEATHTELAVMAARKKVSIKKCLGELVKEDKYLHLLNAVKKVLDADLSYHLDRDEAELIIQLRKDFDELQKI